MYSEAVEGKYEFSGSDRSVDEDSGLVG